MKMKVRILNVYNNTALPSKGLKADYGNSFYFEIGEKRILFDTGRRGNILLNNMKALGISPDEIGTIVFSHGHSDHTGGLPTFLSARTEGKAIEVIMHPTALEPKQFLYLYPIGFPKLSEKQKQGIKFSFVKEPFEVTPGLTTTGEITDRPEKDSTAWYMTHKVNRRRKRDPLSDDLSLVLDTKKGLVIVTGCCHAGLLNTCVHVSKLFNKEIRAILGGTHLMTFKRKEIGHIGDVLEKTYNMPQLYLNHCTGKKAILQLKDRFGPEIVHDFWVGSEMTYEI